MVCFFVLFLWVGNRSGMHLFVELPRFIFSSFQSSNFRVFKASIIYFSLKTQKRHNNKQKLESSL